MATLNLQVAASADDAHERQPGDSFSAVGSGLNMTGAAFAGNRWRAGFRFEATIPIGATITACVWQVKCDSTSVDDPGVDIYFEAADDAADFTTTASVITRALTTETVRWSDTAIGTDFASSPDLSAPLQEVVDRAGRAETFHIMLLGYGSELSKSFSVNSWDLTDHTGAAKLDITYTEPAASSGSQQGSRTILLTGV